MTSTPSEPDYSPAISEYTPPIMLGNGRCEIDTTPDRDGDLEVCTGDGDHVAYLGAADQIVLRDLLNKIHPPAVQPLLNRVTNAVINRAYRDGRIAALDEAADDAESVIACGDVAEVAAPVEGECGRQSAVSARDQLYEDPAGWLREQAEALRAAK